MSSSTPTFTRTPALTAVQHAVSLSLPTAKASPVARLGSLTETSPSLPLQKATSAQSEPSITEDSHELEASEEQEETLGPSSGPRALVDNVTELTRRICDGTPFDVALQENWEDVDMRNETIACAFGKLVDGITAGLRGLISPREVLWALVEANKELERLNSSSHLEFEKLREFSKEMEKGLRAIRAKLDAEEDDSMARQFANAYERSFGGGSTWERAWEGLLDELPSNMDAGLDNPPPRRPRQTFCSFHAPTPRSPSLLASLPSEILRNIFHISSQSLLPRETASIHDRRILHRRRAEHLTNAALVCRSWRSQAQSELVSFAYCTSSQNLDRLVAFLEETERARGVQRLRIDIPNAEEDELWKSAAALWTTCHLLPKVEVGGNLSSTGLVQHFGGRGASNQSEVAFRRTCH